MVSVAHNEPGPSSIPTPNMHPVAAIMPAISNPVTYQVANSTSVLDGSDDLDDDVCAHQPGFVGAFIKCLESVKIPKVKPFKEVTCLEIAPITIPHLFWRVSVCPPSLLPLDNGSHIVLIHDSLVNELGLCKKRLKMPIETDVAMHLNEKKMSVTPYEYVKLPLYDMSGENCTKTVCTIVAKNHCCPVLLGLPFLSHNNIVIDHAE